MLTILPAPATFYTCPGDSHPISRSVHLARLGGAYGPCQTCAHRHDHGLVPVTAQRGNLPAPVAGRSGWLITHDGVRGRYLNDLTRRDAQLLASSLSRLLWSRRPWRGRTDAIELNETSSTRHPLKVVVGFDERPCSPDLAIGAVTGLRQAGCHVLDVGVVNKPLWRSAVQRMSADAGILITGAGHDSSWTGCDFIGTAGSPWSERELNHIVAGGRGPASRLSRTSGSVASLSALEDYLADLPDQFHALRPLSVLIVSPSQLIGRVMQRVGDSLPGEWQCEVSADWRSEDRDRDELDRRMAQRLARFAFDLAVWIPEDGENCRVWDEQAQPLSVARWQNWVCSGLIREHHRFHTGPAVIVDASGGISPRRVSMAGDSVAAKIIPLLEPDLNRLSEVMQQQQALAGVDHLGRLWLGGRFPQCDGILTVSALLRSLSWSDATISEQVR